MVAPPNPLSPAPGTGFSSGKHNTALQGHVAFFDADSDGIIWPSDTYRGFRDIKFGICLSMLSVLIIHFGFSWITQDSWIPDPFFRLKIKNMHRAMHGSSSGSYTVTGEFDQARFNSIFDTYSSEPHTHLTFWEGVRMIRGNRNLFDFFGWFSACFEWLATWILLRDKDPKGLKREDVKGVLMGYTFYQISGRKPQY
ncbi:Caleosin [Panaeolus papilionaceus]|nr:Caleosin [Panaeolus papilionaceus]